MKRETFNKPVILLIAIIISIAFTAMVRPFLVVTLLAGIFAALMQPVYNRFLIWCRGRQVAASLATLFVILFLVLLPLAALTGLVTTQAMQVGRGVSPWIQNQITNPSTLDDLLRALPFDDYIEPYREDILLKSGEIVRSISHLLLNSFSKMTLRTVNIFFMTFIFLYTMYWLLIDGKKILNKILYHIPLEDNDKRRLLTTFTSVTRATLKGTIVICSLQGALAGLAFWFVGFQNAVFWGVIMGVFSLIPLVGMAIIWVPAALILVVYGGYAHAIGLTVFCGFMIPGIWYMLNPILVGKDIKMNELMIFFGTLGGLYMFGFLGIIIGPIIAALFVTAWEIYGIVFNDVLPDKEFFESKQD